MRVFTVLHGVVSGVLPKFYQFLTCCLKSGTISTSFKTNFNSCWSKKLKKLTTESHFLNKLKCTRENFADNLPSLLTFNKLSHIHNLKTVDRFYK